jgi:Cdc6-like AAA superfamily ATPase
VIEENEKNINQILNADAPIKTPDEDLLNRKFYAESIADKILEYSEPKPLIIGIYGPWGHGKTSFLNLISHYLKKNKRKDELDPIHFNPWVFSQTDQLIERLFSTILSKVRQGGYRFVLIALRLKMILNIYSKVFSPTITRFLLTISSLIAYFAIFFPFTIKTQLTVKIAFGIIEAVFLAITWFTNIGVAITDVILGSFNRQSLEDKKSKIERELLTKNMTAIKKRIIIIFDDLDRLMPDEIMLLLKTIKSVINIKGIIILMAFDDEAIKHTLSRNYGKVWEGYLDKIVNIPIYLPAPDREKLASIAFSKIRAVAGYYNTETWDEERWEKALINGLREAYLKQDNLRAIYRYVNRLLFFARQYPGEINMIDLLAIETIRMFYPSLYLYIYRNKGLLTGGFRELEQAIWNQSGEEKEKTISKLAEELSGYEDEALSIMDFLFPRLSSLRQIGEASAEPSPDEINKLQICTPNHFDKYFIYHLSTGAITQIILDDFVKNKHDSSEYTQILNGIIADDLFEDFAGRFESQLANIKDFHIDDIVVSLFNISESIPINAGFKRRLDTRDMFLHSIITNLLLRIGANSVSGRIQHILMRTNALYLPISFVDLINRWKEGDSAKLPPILKPTVPTMIQICVDKIRKDYRDKNLINRKGLRLILERWNEWDEKDQVVEFIKANFGRKELIGFMASYIDWNYEPEPKFMIDLLENLIDPNIIHNYTNSVNSMELSADDREVLRIFGRAYARWSSEKKKSNKRDNDINT